MSAINSIISLTGGGHPQPMRPYLIPLNQYKSDEQIFVNKRYFQYWPEEITDNKQTNWETKNIPGLSHPIYQWISGGAREIGFTAIFTRDRPQSDEERKSLSVSRGLPSTSGSIYPAAGTSDPRNVDIPAAVAWLRSFVYPDYSADGKGHGRSVRAKPPQKLILGLPGMQINQQLDGGASPPDELHVIMTQCDVNYGGFFSDGSPRVAKVQLQFAETIQYNSKITQVDAFAIRQYGLTGYGQTVTTRDKNK